MPDLSPARRLAAAIHRDGYADLPLTAVKEVAKELGAATFGEVAMLLEAHYLPASRCIYLGSTRGFFRYGRDTGLAVGRGPALAGEE